MNDLQLAPPSDSGRTKAIVVAALLLMAIAAAAWWFTPRATTRITVTRESVVAPHVVNQSMAGDGPTVVGTPPSVEDSVYIAADLAIRNERSGPLFITGWTATATLADGSLAAATVVSPKDFARIEPSFPVLTHLLTQPLADDATVGAQATLDGTVLLLFPGMNEATWKAKRDARLTLLLAHGDPQIVPLP